MNTESKAAYRNHNSPGVEGAANPLAMATSDFMGCETFWQQSLRARQQNMSPKHCVSSLVDNMKRSTPRSYDPSFDFIAIDLDQIA
jgi:hypothetical protein